MPQLLRSPGTDVIFVEKEQAPPSPRSCPMPSLLG